jgi:low affinity Fe/Cu permease
MEILSFFTVLVLFIVAIATSFYCGRYTRGRQAISWHSSRKIEETLQQFTRANQGALSEVVDIASQTDENVERLLHMLQGWSSQKKRTRTSRNNIDDGIVQA